MRKIECKVPNKRDNIINEYACLDEESIRIEDIKRDIRNNFSRDIDRILYSLSYSRYVDKTQVFSLTSNDHISKRIIHVQMVSRIARTIGRALGLNEDLIEAASLGHDLGHPPFGHQGEKILNELSLKHNGTYFNHNVQSVRLLMELENDGKGSNISLQVLDAILCHNGEYELCRYSYNRLKTKDDFLNDYQNCYKKKDYSLELLPMTLEGAVVRISDIVAYIGKDVEDAIRLGVIQREMIPKTITDVLGSTNSEIISVIVLDIVKNSYGKPYIELSETVFKAMQELKAFNYKYIYSKSNSLLMLKKLAKIYKHLFLVYVDQLKGEKINSNIYVNYLMTMDSNYIKNNTIYQVIIDYMAGMTDDYFLQEYSLYKNYFKHKDLTGNNK